MLKCSFHVEANFPLSYWPWNFSSVLIIWWKLLVRSMWETICDAQAGFWLNSKFLSKFSRKPLSGISDQKAPPQWKTSDLRWPKFTPKYPPPKWKLQIWDDQSLAKYPPPVKNFWFEMTKVYSEIPPPPPKKLQIWDDQSLLQNTSPPNDNFRFEMTKVYSKIPPPQWKTSDLRWPKFTLKYPPPPPQMKNFRFEMTKVYSEIPPPPNEKLQIWDDQSLLWNTPPPPKGLQSGRSYVETNLYPPWIPLVVSIDQSFLFEQLL